MVKTNPFNEQRRVGEVFKVAGTTAEILLSRGSKNAGAYLGERLGNGTIGQFVLIEVEGVAIFCRIQALESTLNHAVKRQSDKVADFPVQATVQLLSTLEMNGNVHRGVSKYPVVGNAVYAASNTITKLVIGSSHRSENFLQLGVMSVDETIPVQIPFSQLFGRHAAIVGSTGSGKSWTLAHITESVHRAGGKMILVDATGEFSTQENHAKHLTFTSLEDEPDDAVLVGVPHRLMRESDRNAFLNPSSGVQLPKLREAIKSLRLAHAIANDSNATDIHKQIIDQEGAIAKAQKRMSTIGSPARQYIDSIENPHADFSLRALARQVQFECIWPSDKNQEKHFGNTDWAQIGYVSPLISRINDLVSTPEIMEVIVPPAGTADLFEEIKIWLGDPKSYVLRISLRHLTFANNLREIIVNILGQWLLQEARQNVFRGNPLLVAIDEAHQFFDVTVGDELTNTRLNAFDLIAKEGRKYGLTVCLATQRPGDLPTAVMSQVGITIAHRLAEGSDRRRVEQSASELDHSAARLLPGLIPGEAVLMGVDFPVPVSVKVSTPSRQPVSDGPSYSNWSLRHIAEQPGQ